MLLFIQETDLCFTPKPMVGFLTHTERGGGVEATNYIKFTPATTTVMKPIVGLGKTMIAA